MVSFQCDACADTVKKPQLDKHRQKCWGTFTCLDCSTTFRNQEYKSHTTCVSEAEKYQGALYKGPKKGRQQHPPDHAAVASQIEANPNTSEGTTSSPSTSSIHPSRLHVLRIEDKTFGSSHHAGPSSTYHDNSRNSRNSRGRAPTGHSGRGSSGAQRASGQNSLRPKDGMRSWGSPATTDTTTDELIPRMATPVEVITDPSMDAQPKGKRKKGDKGGTGIKANSKNPRTEGATTSQNVSASLTLDPTEPAFKRRKLEAKSVSDEVAQPAMRSASVEKATDKTAKRLRKNLKKLSEKGDWNETSLASWLKRLGKSKSEAVDVGEILESLRISFADGKWTVSAP